MAEASTESKPPNLEDDQDDSWEDLTGEFESEESCNIPQEAMKEYSGEENFSTPEASTRKYSRDASCSTTEESIQEYSREASCSTTEESTKEYSGEASCSAPENSTKEYSEEERENGAETGENSQKLPSFEVLTDFPKPDFLKLREDVFTQHQTTFAFRNMTTSGCSLLGLRHRVHRKGNWLSNSHNVHEKKVIKLVKKKGNKNKPKKVKGRALIATTSGLVLALFATNVFTFVLGCSLGWWSRDAIPTLSIYEFHLDPALF